MTDPPSLGPSSLRAVRRLRQKWGCLGWALLLLVVVAAGVWIGSKSRAPRLGDGQPLLRLPFERGVVVLCEQGNSPELGTHSPRSPQNTYALDFSNVTLETVNVVAAADGVVTFLVADSPKDDYDAGNGYGNQVRVAHADGYFTFYSHLDQVEARAGQQLRSGDVIGTMGRTGAAGGRHLHFSLHRGSVEGPGVRDSLPMSGIVTAVMGTEPVHFTVLAGAGFLADSATPWKGSLYGSENASGTTIGKPDAELAETLRRSYDTLRTALDDRVTLSEIARDHEHHDVGWARRRVAPIRERSPKSPAARYIFATAVLLPEKRFDAAKLELQTALDANDGAGFEGWVPAFTEAHLGIVAFEQGDQNEARRRINHALDSYTSERLLQQVLPYLRRMPASERGDAGAETAPSASADPE